jgi:hypothetical protein
MKHRTLAALLLFSSLALPHAALAQEEVFSRTYQRSIGAPVTESASFAACDTSGPFSVIVTNGPGGTPKVASGTVTLNGVDVIRPSDFSREVDQIEKPLAALEPINQIDVRLAGAAGGSILLTMRRAQSCGIRITSPAANGTVLAPEVLVSGTYPASCGQDVGVTVNGTRALAGGGRFAALVPVDTQVTTLTAVAKNAAGTTLDDDTIPVTVQAGPAEPAVHLRASPVQGVAPLSVELTLVGNLPVTQVALDQDGDGDVDFQGPALEGVRFTYPAPGVYLALATATTPGGLEHATVAVQAYDRPALEGVLQARWTAMKNALRQGDVEGALLFITRTARDRYRAAFQAIAADLPQIDSVLGAITFARAWGTEVVFQMPRADGGVDKSFEVRFGVDDDGVWRLRAF